MSSTSSPGLLLYCKDCDHLRTFLVTVSYSLCPYRHGSADMEWTGVQEPSGVVTGSGPHTTDRNALPEHQARNETGFIKILQIVSICSPQ